jgi:L-amino acid N-acyltransferase YncA
VWERCCLGLPAISLCIAENQRQQILDAAEIGLLYAPAMGGDLVEMIHNHTILLLENQPLLKLISKLAINEVDGKGATRTVRAMGFQTIHVRPANHHDLHDLFQWRNHHTIRDVSINKEIILWEDHERWFAEVANATNLVLLIGEEGSRPVGVVRFDKLGNRAQVSIYIVPDSGFVGYGHNLLNRAEEWLKEYHPDIKSVRANVLGKNLKSENLFCQSGYQRHSTCFEKDLSIRK